MSRALGSQERIASGLHNIGIVYYRQGRYEEALTHFRRSLAIKREQGNRGRVANNLISIGIVLERQGQYEKALQRYQESLAIDRELGNQENIADALNAIGTIHRYQGNYEKALAHFREALSTRRELGDRRGIASILTNIGTVYQLQGRYEQALQHYEEALEIDRALQNRRGIASVLNNIGNIHRLQGRYEDALSSLREALSMRRELGNQRGVASALVNLGNVYYDRAQYERALRRYRQALRINLEIGRRRGAARSLDRIGTLHLKRGRLQAATDTLTQAVRLAEELRLSATSPEARRSLLSTQIGTYRSLTAASVRAGRSDSALRSVEQARARLLADRLAGTATGDTAFALPSVAELRETLGPDEAALLYANAGAEWPLTALVVTRDTTVARELPDSTVRAAIKREYPTRLNRLRREDGPLTDALAPNPSSEQHATPSLAETVRLYRYYLTREGADASVRNDLARRLHGLLVEPIADAIEGKSEVIAVPTGALGYLPFETLRARSGRYLVETRHVRYAQSLTVLRQLQERTYAGRERPLLALGGASYTSDETMEGGAVLAEARRGSTRVATEEQATTLLRSATRQLDEGFSPRRTYARLGYAQWANLPGTRDEVEALRSLVGSGAMVLTGTDASEPALRREAEDGRLADYRYLHFATHGIAVPEAPELSALVLSQVGASDSLAAKDGYLTMEEIATLKMQADVAVLSACQTGLGKIVAGEGVVSLSHAFLRAGANATLVSQWKVLDESTRQFMTAVYKRSKKEDTSFAEAVTDTKRAFIDGAHGEKNTDPLRWAPFVYYGRE
jgi:tetratricopeptide (TPR) repeat protein